MESAIKKAILQDFLEILIHNFENFEANYSRKFSQYNLASRLYVIYYDITSIYII